MMKYENIILCGIDLNNSNYFYEDDYYKSMFPNLYSGQNKKTYLNDPNIQNITMESIIYIIDSLFSKNVKIFTLNKESALYPKIQLFKMIYF